MSDVEHIEQDGILLAGLRFVLRRRGELKDRLSEIEASVPEDIVTGPPVLVLHYVSSEKEGTLADLGLPVSREFSGNGITTRALPSVESMSIEHCGPMSGLGEAYRQVFDLAAERGIVSDEYGMEVLHDVRDQENCRVEVRLVIHPWEGIFREGLEKVLGSSRCEEVFGDCSALNTGSPLSERFTRIKNALSRLEDSARDFDIYDCVSRCAHVFPKDQILKLKSVFDDSRADGLTVLEAVDRVIAFMDSDPGWSEGAVREGNIIYSAKGPRDREAYESAQTDEERAEAACFCPIIRKKLKDGMPASFCYCGGGWYRQQWEGATGTPVRVEILSSLLSGGDECRFAIHLQE